MSKLKTISDTVTGKTTLAAGALFAACGTVQIVHSQRGTGEKVVGLAGHLSLGFFLGAMILVSPLFVALGRRARAGRAEKAAMAAGVGTLLLGLTCISSLAMGHDGVWFRVIAPVTNVAWLFGSIALAVSLKRAGRVPAFVALGLPVMWIGSIPLGTHGGGLISGAYCFAVGHLLASDALAPAPRQQVEPAPARA
jgi:hypothetical protein